MAVTGLVSLYVALGIAAYAPGFPPDPAANQLWSIFLVACICTLLAIGCFLLYAAMIGAAFAGLAKVCDIWTRR